MKRLDPSLYVIWRNYAWDSRTGKRIYRKQDQEPMPDPHFTVLKQCPDGTDRPIFRSDSFGHREVWRLEGDVGRRWSPQKINEFLDREAETAEERQQKDWKQQQSDFVSANKKKLRTVFDGKNLSGPIRKRDATITSYANQPNRSSSWDSCPATLEQHGWELPWEPGENE